MKCTYCGKDAEYTENRVVYGRNYGTWPMIWLCRKCDAYVGCHKDTKEPLGRMADKELRSIKKDAKEMFIAAFLDGDWNVSNYKKNDAYEYLAEHMKLPRDKVHFGMFDEKQCKLALDISTDYLLMTVDVNEIFGKTA